MIVYSPISVNEAVWFVSFSIFLLSLIIWTNFSDDCLTLFFVCFVGRAMVR